LKIGELELENDRYKFKWEDKAEIFRDEISQKEKEIAAITRERENLKTKIKIIEQHVVEVHKGQ
jgi:hypothetical protein